MVKALIPKSATDNFIYEVTGGNILTLSYEGDDAAKGPVEITFLNSTD